MTSLTIRRKIKEKVAALSAFCLIFCSFWYNWLCHRNDSYVRLYENHKNEGKIIQSRLHLSRAPSTTTIIMLCQNTKIWKKYILNEYQILRGWLLIRAVAVKVLTSLGTAVDSVMFSLRRRAASIFTNSWAWKIQKHRHDQI